MNIGTTSMDAPAQAAVSMLKKTMDFQMSMTAKLLQPATGQQNTELQAATAASYGLGTNLDMMV